LHILDTIEELQKIINTKRAVLPPKNKINTADKSTTDVDDNNYVIGKKVKIYNICTFYLYLRDIKICCNIFPYRKKINPKKF